jgi:hypothetical protein
MARNKTPGDAMRRSAVKPRSQIKNPITGAWVKRDDGTAKVMDVKADKPLFKGVRKKKRKSSSEVLEEIVKRQAPLMKRLAKR